MSKLYFLLGLVVGVPAGVLVHRLIWPNGFHKKVAKTAEEEEDKESKQARDYVFDSTFENTAAHYDIALAAREIADHDLAIDKKGELTRRLRSYLRRPAAQCKSDFCAEFANLVNSVDAKTDAMKNIKEYSSAAREQDRRSFNELVSKMKLSPSLDTVQSTRPLGFTIDGFGVYPLSGDDHLACKTRGDVLMVVTGNPRILFVPTGQRITSPEPRQDALNKASCVYQWRFKAGKTWVLTGPEIIKFLGNENVFTKGTRARSKKASG